MFKLEKAAWEEQHSSGTRAFNPAASFTLGSVVGSVRNVLRGTGSFLPQQQPRGPSMDEQSMPDDAAGVIAVPDMDMYMPPVAPIPVRYGRSSVKAAPKALRFVTAPLVV